MSKWSQKPSQNEPKTEPNNIEKKEGQKGAKKEPKMKPKWSQKGAKNRAKKKEPKRSHKSRITAARSGMREARLRLIEPA